MSVSGVVKTIQDIMRRDEGDNGDAQRIQQMCWLFFLKIIDDQDQQLELLNPKYKSPIPRKFQWRTWAANPEGITGESLIDFINNELFPSLKSLNVTGKDTERAVMVTNVFKDSYNNMRQGSLLRQVVNKVQEINFNRLADRQHFGDIYEQILAKLQSAGNAGEFYTPRALTNFMVELIDPKLGESVMDPACGTGGFITSVIRHVRESYVKTIEDEKVLQTSLHGIEKKQLPLMLCTTNMLLHNIENPNFIRRSNTLARPYTSYTDADRVEIIVTNPPFGGEEETGIESNYPPHLKTRETADLFLAIIIRLLKNQGRAAIILPDTTLFADHTVKKRLKEELLTQCNLHTIVRLPPSTFQPYASVGTSMLFFTKGEPTKSIWYYEQQVPSTQKAYSKTRPMKSEHLDDLRDWWHPEDQSKREENENAWQVGVEEINAHDFNLDIKNPNRPDEIYADPSDAIDALSKSNSQIEEIKEELVASLRRFF
jgi:type I restriction enzyme M protein